MSLYWRGRSCSEITRIFYQQIRNQKPVREQKVQRVLLRKQSLQAVLKENVHKRPNVDLLKKPVHLILPSHVVPKRALAQRQIVRLIVPSHAVPERPKRAVARNPMLPPQRQVAAQWQAPQTETVISEHNGITTLKMKRNCCPLKG